MKAKRTSKPQTLAQRRSSQENWLLFQLSGARGNITHLPYTISSEYLNESWAEVFRHMNIASNNIKTAIQLVRDEQERRRTK